MKLRLLWKLVAINVIVVLIVVAIVDVALRVLAADYFSTLVAKYHIAPGTAHEMFLDAVERYLAAAAIAACVVAIALSAWMTRRTLRPLTLVMQGARQISAGNYAVRIDESNCGEVSELAKTFNRMVESLVRIERLRKDMVINVAHELRTPLTNIRGYLEALIDSVMEPSAEVLGSLHDETLRLVKLVEDLLQLARAEAARNDLHLDAIELDSVVTQVVDLFRLKFSAKGLHVETRLEAKPTELRGDPHQLAQILTNLLENAWRYSPPGGRVTITATLLGDFVRVSVANISIAAASADHESLFERFYRGEKSRSREHGGAGLGLAIVKELVERHGGAVGSESFHEERRVWFTWPTHRAL